MQLRTLVGHRIVVFGPKLLEPEHGPQRLQTVTLLGVDDAGIWIESDLAANSLADRFHLKPAGRSAFFIPFAQITAIIASSEEATVIGEEAAA